MKNQKGFSLVELLVVVIILAIIAAIAIPSLLASRRAANESAAVSSMRSFHSANMTYQAMENPNSFAPTAGDLSTKKLIDSSFAAAIDNGTPLKSSYVWDYTFASTTPQNYTLTALQPTGANNFQDSYFLNQEGVIRYTEHDATTGAAAAPTASSPSIP